MIEVIGKIEIVLSVDESTATPVSREEMRRAAEKAVAALARHLPEVKLAVAIYKPDIAVWTAK